MKKLRLDLDQLAVESFGSTDTPAGHGTVRGHSGGSYQTTINDVECYQHSVYVDCPEEAGNG